MAVDPSLVVLAGDLSLGLQHASDLDDGFDQSLAPPGQSASSNDHVLASATSVTEAVLGADASSSCSQPSVTMDVRFNQLDEIYSQESNSILANCGPVAESSGGELLNSQIDIVSNDNNVSNLSENNVGNLSESNMGNLSESNVSNLSEDNIGNVNGDNNRVNCYGSIISPDDAPFGPSDDDPSFDFEMSESSGLKRSIIDVLSDDSSDDHVEDPFCQLHLLLRSPKTSVALNVVPKVRPKSLVLILPVEVLRNFPHQSRPPQVKNCGSQSFKK